MTPPSNSDRQNFPEAAHNWDLERLYDDLATAKKTYNPYARKGLSEPEKEHLRGLLCGYSPDKIGAQIHKTADGIKSALSKTLYRYVEILTKRPTYSLKSWEDVAEWLAPNYTINPAAVACKQDWDGAGDISNFYGRRDELGALEQSIVQNNCRLIAIFGMGGIGKTTLAVRIAKQLQDRFEYVIRRSLSYAPPIQQLLAQLIQFVSDGQATPEQPTISQLMEYLRSHRCLLMLDEWEGVFASGEMAGRYADGYGEYSQLIQRIANENHQSCLVLTSREKSTEMTLWERDNLQVKLLHLKGLKPVEARDILADNRLSDPDEWDNLIETYRGNPLALKIICGIIRDFFNGSVSQFRQRNTIVIEDFLGELLEQQVGRLSPFEKEIVYWLAIEPDPVSFSQLSNQILLPVYESDLIKAVKSLRQRSLIETISTPATTTFTLQPTLKRYIVKVLNDNFCEEIVQAIRNQTIDGLELLRNLSIVTEPNPESDIRARQFRLIVMPIRDQLTTFFRSDRKLANHLNEIQSMLEGKSALEVGYATDNLQNLLLALSQIDS